MILKGLQNFGGGVEDPNPLPPSERHCSKQYGKKDAEVSQLLKKIFGLSPLPQAEVSECFALESLSNFSNDKRVELFCDYLLENYIDADSTFGPNVMYHFISLHSNIFRRQCCHQIITVTGTKCACLLPRKDFLYRAYTIDSNMI